MNLLDIIPGLKKASSAKGGEYHGPCPLCGGRDRFHVWPEQGTHGTWWCSPQGCDKGGDAIEYFRHIEGLSYRDACARLDIEPASQAASRLAAKDRRGGFTPAATISPAATWSIKAAAFVEYCHQHLIGNQDQLAWLAGRGINLEMVAKYRLGWNPADTWRERSAWGLPDERKENGKLKKLWLPRGLVIPWNLGAEIHRIRIRRPEGEPRYFVVPGSKRSPLISKPDATGYLVVESELDAILLDSAAGDLVGVVSMGNSSAKPDEAILPSLRQALHISVAMDSDTPKPNQATGRMEAAGAKASRWWLENFDQAERHPIIGGKDPGEAFQAGVDLRAWVLAGLPPRFRVAAAIPVKFIQPAAPAAAEPATKPASRIVDLVDGRRFHLVDNQEDWNQLVASGEIVFSEHELSRLHVACGACGKDGVTLAGAALDVKAVFGGAYIRAGRGLA